MLRRLVCVVLSLCVSGIAQGPATAATPSSQPQQATTEKAAPAAETKSSFGDAKAAAAPAPTVTLKPAANANGAFVLEDGTPVKLRTGHTISSADAHVGDTLDFEVLEEVKVGDTVVIPQGGIAWATVTEAEHKKRMGRGGKLNLNIDNVKLANGQKAPLRATQGGNAGGHVGAMTGAMVATAIVFWPAAPLFLFMHGKDLTIPKGTPITAYINGNTPLEKASFLPKPSPEALAATTPSAAPEQLAISSTPPNAEIELDGAFVGDTPSTLSLTPGDHTIAVTHKGFKRWERKMKTTSGTVSLNVEMEPEAAPAGDGSH